MCGLDVSLHVGRVLASLAPGRAAILIKLVNKKTRPQKRRGFYRWRDGKAQKDASQNAAEPEDLQDRLILPMLNEAGLLSARSTIQDADLLDAGCGICERVSRLSRGRCNMPGERSASRNVLTA